MGGKKKEWERERVRGGRGRGGGHHGNSTVSKKRILSWLSKSITVDRLSNFT